jgi:hypothetical protein
MTDVTKAVIGAAVRAIDLLNPLDHGKWLDDIGTILTHLVDTVTAGEREVYEKLMIAINRLEPAGSGPGGVTVYLSQLRRMIQTLLSSPPSSGRDTGIHRLSSESQNLEPRIVDAVNDHYWELLKANPDAAEHCQRCGRAYSLVWRAPDELWHAVTGCMDGGGLYCPECFVSMAREKGIEVYWDACRAEAWDKPAAAAPMLAPSSPARRRSEMSHYHGLCMKCGRPLVHTGETTLCSQCMGGTMVVGHGAVYPVDTMKMPEPVIINRADFGEVHEAEKRGREAGIREVRNIVEQRLILASNGCCRSSLKLALDEIDCLLPEGEGKKG